MDAIVCPYCKVEYEIESDYDFDEIVTYHGSQDGPVEIECPDCNRVFYVKEYVKRIYFVYKDKKDA